jgi:hypothetical protein
MAEERMLLEFDLSAASLGVLEVLCDEAADESLFNDIYRANLARTEVLQFLYDHWGTPDDLIKEIAPVLQLPVREKKEPPYKEEPGEEKKSEPGEERKRDTEPAGEARLMKSENLLQKIQKLNVGEKVQLATKGGKEIRGILIKDSSKEVVKKVMENPKMTESEVDLIAKSRSVPDDVLRLIAKKKEWMKNYSIMLGLVANPKTPAGVAMPFVKNVKKKDLVLLEKNKNVSQAVRAMAKKFLATRRPG